jgi:hypothetical protein
VCFEFFFSHSANLDGKENPMTACCHAIDFNGKTIIIHYYLRFIPV